MVPFLISLVIFAFAFGIFYCLFSTAIREYRIRLYASGTLLTLFSLVAACAVVWSVWYSYTTFREQFVGPRVSVRSP